MNVLSDVLGDSVLESIRCWLDDPLEGRFPYGEVLGAFHAQGKEFVPDELLRLLAEARAAYPRFGGSPARTSLLRTFLDVALDKFDGVYDYPSYTALRLLPMPSVDEPDLLAEIAVPRRDRLVLQLIADLARFELGALDGSERRLPQMRPTPRDVEKRLRLSLRVAGPALDRVVRCDRPSFSVTVDHGRWLVATMDERMDGYERDALRLSILPVYTIHDEYFFIRTLQLFETTFATLAVLLQRVIADLVDGDEPAASAGLRDSAGLLAESAPLFSMLATMQVEAFRTFRDFTSGASAIQSRSYKLVESLCRRPDDDRVSSPAYTSVPEIRDRVSSGTLTVDDVLDMHLQRPGAGGTEVIEAMALLSNAVLKWRQTHYSLAVRNLGQRSGTGYTEGTPYLDSVRKLPLFRDRSVPSPRPGSNRCPVAGLEVGGHE